MRLIEQERKNISKAIINESDEQANNSSILEYAKKVNGIAVQDLYEDKAYIAKPDRVYINSENKNDSYVLWNLSEFNKNGEQEGFEGDYQSFAQYLVVESFEQAAEANDYVIIK